MTNLRTRELATLLLGDIIALYAALYVTLFVRYLSIPSGSILYNHLQAFSVLIAVWTLVFFIGGLYDKHTVFLKKRLPQKIIQAQILNILIAALFFFFVSAFGIAPKTNLVIYLFISSGFVLLWRLTLFPRIGARVNTLALMIGDGSEVEELVAEVNGNIRYNFAFVRMLSGEHTEDASFAQKFERLVRSEDIGVIVGKPRDLRDERLSELLFQLTFVERKVTVVDFSRMYEEIFDRIPLSALSTDWFLRNISPSSKKLHTVIKRLLDIVGGLALGGILLLGLPLLAALIYLPDRGPVFIRQKRIGKGGKEIEVWKLRTMRENKSASAEWTTEERGTNPVTRVGAILRKSSIDEWPQAWSILKGDMSLIGPRNDILGLAQRSEEAIPFYSMRTAIKPGITGWAQINQVYSPGNISPQSIEDNRIRFAYDLYYVKNRSIILDLMIALRTLATLLDRFGVSLRVR